MKKQFNYVKKSLIVVCILCILALITFSINQDTKHKVILIIALCGLCIDFLIYLIYLRDVKKIVYEIKKDDIEISLINEDDYLALREAMDPRPMENSEEEALILEEYRQMTREYEKKHYHYVVRDISGITMLFYADKTNIEIIFAVYNDPRGIFYSLFPGKEFNFTYRIKK